MKEIQLWTTGVCSFQLAEREYFQDSNGNIVGFRELPLWQDPRYYVGLAPGEMRKIHYSRPAFEFHTRKSKAPALGTIRVLDSGMKYLQLTGKKSRHREP
jgi:hypothetical protein